MKIAYLLLPVLFFLGCKSETKSDKSQKSTATIQTTKQAIEWKEDKTIEVFDAPESVAFNGRHYFVSNVGGGGNPMAKDKNGFISKLDLEGNIISLRYIIELDAPKGMGIIGDMLYTADIDKIRGINLKSGTQTYELDLSSTKVKFLNDITIKNDNQLFVSSTDLGKVFSVNIKEKKFESLKTTGDLSGVNGLDYDKKANRIYLNSFGKNDKPVGQIAYLDLSKKTASYHRIGKYEGYLDGIYKIGDDLLVSDWLDFEKGGHIIKVNINSGKEEIIQHELVNGPADFYYNEETKVMWLPKMGEGKVLAKKLTF